MMFGNNQRYSERNLERYYDMRRTPRERAQKVLQRVLANFPVGSVVQWIHAPTGDRYRGIVLPQDINVRHWSEHYDTTHVEIKVIGRTLNPVRKDTYAIGSQQDIRVTDLQRADIPTEANKTRKSELLTELRFKPEDGVFPGGINFQEAKERFLHETAKTQSTKRNRRKSRRYIQ
jgi:hypothetical protein